MVTSLLLIGIKVLHVKYLKLESLHHKTCGVNAHSLIAIRVDVESSAYVQNAYVMKNCYIGYEENGTVEYKQSLGRDVYYPYVAGYGFDSSSFLSDYGCGNGADITGYFFFLIPADVQEIIEHANNVVDLRKAAL